MAAAAPTTQGGYVNSAGNYVSAGVGSNPYQTNNPTSSGGFSSPTNTAPISSNTYSFNPGSAKSGYPVMTSSAATQNFNTAQQDYTQNIVPKMQIASQNQAQQSSLPIIAGYNVSANPTGNQGETRATNQTTGNSYYITPQQPAVTASDIKGILSSDNSSAPASNTQTSSVPSQTPSQQATSQTGVNPNVESQNYQSQIVNTNDELGQAYNTFKQTINSVMTGAFPLSGPQQALVDATNQAFQQMNTQAQLKAAALSSETGGVADKVNATAGELTNITAQQSATVANLEIGFQKQNYQMVTDAYNAFKDLEGTKLDSIKELHNLVMDTYNKALVASQKVTDNINSVAENAAKNGADAKTIAAIRSSTDEGQAMQAAGGFLQSASGTLGDYLQYKRDAEAKGLVPTDYTTYKDNEAYKAEKLKQQAAQDVTSSDKTQQKLEQQYRGVLSKEFSSRTGALGVENSKVNQANHLNSLFQQYYDPKSGQYNIPKAQYGEVVLGLANLISPSGVASDSLREEITQKTLKGDIAGAISYITGTPMTGSTQDVFKNLVDSIDRQAETAVRNRETALQNLRDQAPTDLEQSRINALNKSTNMVSYEGQDRLSKSRVNDFVKTTGSSQAPNGQSWSENIAKLYEIPGATDSDIEQYLQAQGLIE